MATVHSVANKSTWRYVVAIDVGTSGVGVGYHAIPPGGVTSLRGVDSRLTVYAPGRRVKENEGKAPTAVCLEAAPPHALVSIGSDAYEDFIRADEEGTADE